MNRCEFTVLADGSVETYCNADVDNPDTECDFYKKGESIIGCVHQDNAQSCVNSGAFGEALKCFSKRIKCKEVWYLEDSEK